jgi:HK97 family phage prohead protease/HK97 family phage major capsid protein
VPFGEIGNTSAGQVVFEKGSISYNTGGKIKLLLEHNAKDPIGMMQSASEDASGIYASFKVAPTTKGNDALIEASELRDGLSVGVIVDAAEPRNGILYVTKASLKEVSLVQAAAFSTASVSAISATEVTPEPIEETPTQPTESEASVENATPATEVEAQKVEASQPSYTPVAHTEIRNPIKTKSNYLQHSVLAKLGNDDSVQYVRAADAYAKKAMTFADDSFTTNPAFSPVNYIPTVIDTAVGARPTIDACGGARVMPATGMTISHPKITTSGTVASTAEGAAPSETGIVSAYVNATVTKYAGLQRYSQELLLRSDPSFFDAMLENMTRAYNKATDAAVIAEIVSGGTQASTQAATIAGIQAYVAQAAPAVYAGAGEVATAFIAGTSIWSLLIGANDSTGRSIYNAAMPSNANGQSTPRTLRGDVMGLDLWVDSNMVATTIDDAAFIITPSAIAIYESPVLQLSTNVPSSGEIEVELFGFLATKTLIATGLQRYNLT